MGTLNPEIILGAKTPQLTLPDPVEQYGAALRIKTLLGQQDLQGIQLQSAQQGLSDDAATRAAYTQSGGDLGTLRALLAKGGQYKEVQAIDKLMLDNAFKQSEIGKNTTETQAKATEIYRDAIGQAQTPEQARQLIAANYNDPVMGPLLARHGSLQEHQARVPDNQEQFIAWQNHVTLGKNYAKENAPKITSLNLGGTEQLVATPGLGGAPTVLSSTPRTATPGERMVDARARERLAYDQAQPKGQVVQTEQGIMLADPRAGTAQPMLGPDGQPLERPLKAIPPSANTGILENANNLRRAEQALALVEGKTVNTAKGSTTATGFKGYLPGAILNRTDPTGVETRAAIADLGSLIIHERSGAAVTASESPRLVPFIPQVTDDHATVVKKLRRFTEIYRDMAKNLDETYSKDQGYRPNPVSARSSATPAETAKPTGGIKFLGFE
jgi:hypothetical protein